MQAAVSKNRAEGFPAVICRSETREMTMSDKIASEQVNPDIRCRAVDIPPYRDDTAHACKWEYWL